MKRSDMLKAIEREMKKSLDQGYGYGVTSGRVLALILDLGMLPPTTIDLPDSYNRAEGTYGYEVNEWEPEE